MRTKTISRRVLIPLMVIVIFLLIACGSATAPAPVFDPNKGEITKTVNGQTFVIGWEASSGTSTVDQSKVPLCVRNVISSKKNLNALIVMMVSALSMCWLETQAFRVERVGCARNRSGG